MTEQQLQRIQVLLSDVEKELGVLRAETEGRILDADNIKDLPDVMVRSTLRHVEVAQDTLSAALGYLRRNE